MSGVQTPNLPPVNDLDDVVGNYNGNTVRLPVARLAALLSAQVGPTFQTRAVLYADLSWPAGTIATVWGDTAGQNGVYRKSGVAGSGSWSRMGDLPQNQLTTDQLAAKADQAALATEATARINATRDAGVLPLANIGGTANAITADIAPAMEGVTLSNLSTVELIPGAANTGAVTLDVGGAGAWPVQRRDGSALAAGDLKANVSLVLRRRANAWRAIHALDSDMDGKVAVETTARINATRATGILPLASVAGTANAITAVIAPAVGLAISDRSTVLLIPAADPGPGTVTLDVDGAGAWPMQRSDGSSIQPGDMKQGVGQQWRRAGDAWRMMGVADSEVKAVVDAGQNEVNTRTAALEMLALDVPLLHPFLDKEGRLLAAFNTAGELDHVHPSEAVRARMNYAERIADPALEGYAAIFVDAEDKILASIPLGFDGSVSGSTAPPPAPSAPAVKRWPLINSTPLSVSVAEITRTHTRLPIQVTAKGRAADADIAVNGSGLCHPSVVHAPGGWRGYRYWLAFTPYFGAVGQNDQYENPHVVATNDWQTWVEPAGGRLDMPEEGNGSYWSDTHLALGDDGCLHLWYRGYNFSFGVRCYAHRWSRDGVTWSARRLFNIPGQGSLAGLTPASEYLSPAFHRVGAGWACYNLVRPSGTLSIPAQAGSTTTHVVRRSARSIDDDFGAYDASQVVSYSPRMWGDTNDPWHLDSLFVEGVYVHLINTSPLGQSSASGLYLAVSSDGWNFTVLQQVTSGAYRSSLHVESVEGNIITLGMVVGYRPGGTFDLFTAKLEIN